MRWALDLEHGNHRQPLLGRGVGLAVSQQFDEVLWAHNDSGSETTLFALGRNGEDLASFSLPEIGGVDIEDMSLIDGTIHLADIGDNEQRRDSVFIYRFPEPDPFSVSDQVDNRAEIVDVDVIELVYEDKAHDAESFLIDPVTNDAVVIAKTFRVGGGRGTLLSPAPADVFTAPLPDRTATTTPSTTPTILRRAGSVALDQLAVDAVATGPPDALFTQVGLDGLATRRRHTRRRRGNRGANLRHCLAVPPLPGSVGG